MNMVFNVLHAGLLLWCLWFQINHEKYHVKQLNDGFVNIHNYNDPGGIF